MICDRKTPLGNVCGGRMRFDGWKSLTIKHFKCDRCGYVQTIFQGDFDAD